MAEQGFEPRESGSSIHALNHDTCLPLNAGHIYNIYQELTTNSARDI